MKNKVFQPWNGLRRYMTLIRHDVSVWKDFFQTREIDWLSRRQLREWFKRLETTLNILENYYVYDDLGSLYVEREESGFPQRRHLDILVAERELPNGDRTAMQREKQSFMDTLFSEQRISISQLEKVAKENAHRMLHMCDILLPFFFSGIEECVSPTSGRRAFTCTWERYVDMPMKYVMLFEASETWSPQGDDLQALKNMLQDETSFIGQLESLARRIDITDARIHPKWIGRVILGPIWIAGVTRDDNVLQHIVNHLARDGEMLAASQVIYEYVISEDEATISGVRDMRGRPHKHVQKFAVKLDHQHYARGATHVEEAFFAPHDVVQQLDGDYRKKISHQLHSYVRS